MKAFLINLDKDKLRLQNADAQLKRLGIDYERVPAIYGKEIPEAEFKKVFNRFRWWCSVGWNIIAGPVGCALSHYSVYRKMVEDDIPFCCIFEDDVSVRDELPEVLKYVEEHIDPGKPEVVLLHDHTPGRSADSVKTQEPLHPFLEPSSGDECTEGYVITRIAAARLLKVNLPLKITVDQWDRWVRLGLITLYHARPTVCSQDHSFESVVQPAGAIMVKDLPWYKLPFHKFKRLVGRSIDSFLMFFERRRYKKLFGDSGSGGGK